MVDISTRREGAAWRMRSDAQYRAANYVGEVLAHTKMPFLSVTESIAQPLRL
jgi:hypothetical protein